MTEDPNKPTAAQRPATTEDVALAKMLLAGGEGETMREIVAGLADIDFSDELEGLLAFEERHREDRLERERIEDHWEERERADEAEANAEEADTTLSRARSIEIIKALWGVPGACRDEDACLDDAVSVIRSLGYEAFSDDALAAIVSRQVERDRRM